MAAKSLKGEWKQRLGKDGTSDYRLHYGQRQAREIIQKEQK